MNRAPLLTSLLSLLAIVSGCVPTVLPTSANIAINSQELSPTNIKVGPGTTVVWQNNSEAPVKLKFSENPISTTCNAARGFTLGAKGISESSPIAVGEVVSLCFLRPQRYDYTIETILPKEDNREPKVSVSGFIEVSSLN